MRELFADMATTGIKSAYDIPPESGCIQLLNADLGIQGAVKKRNGRKALFASLGNGGIDGLHAYQNVLYAFWEGKLYKKGTDGWGTALIDTLANTEVHPTDYRTKFYFGDGAGIYESDGTAVGTKKVVSYVPGTGEPANLLADTTSPLQKCKWFTVHWWNMLVATCSPDAPDTLYVSALTAPDYFPASQALGYYNSVYKLPQKGHTIRGAVVFYDVLVVFTDKGIFGMFGDGPGTYSIKPINEQYGCLSGESIELVDNAIWFLASDGIVRKLTTPTENEKYFNVQPVGLDFKPDIAKLATKSDAVAVYHDQQYRLSFPSENATFRCYVNQIDRATKEPNWVQDTNCCGSYAVLGETLYSASPTQGVVWQENSGLNDDGRPYTFRMMKHVGSGDLVKIMKVVVYYRTHQTMAHLRVNIIADDIGKPNKQTASATLELPADARSVLGSWILGQGKLGSSPNTPSREFKVKVEGHFFIVDITGSQDEDFEIVGFRLYGIVKQQKARKDGVSRG